MRSGGWRYRITDGDWSALSERYANAPHAVNAVGEVVRSIVRSSARSELLFVTSMWDLVVTTAPVSPPPLDVVIVRGAMGSHRVPVGRVRVEHVPLVGHADVIDREASDAVPLFWRFMAEKYGVDPG